MNKDLRTSFFIITLTLFIPLVIFGQDRTPFGYVKITAAQKPAAVYLDNIEFSWDSVNVIKLPAGKHTIAARRDKGLQAGDLDYINNIMISKDDTLTVKLLFENSVTIQSTIPSAASVFINDSLSGTTPFSFNPIQNAVYTVRVSKVGYLDTTFTLVSAHAPITLILKPRGNSIKSLNDNEFVNERWRKQGFYNYKKWLFISSIATVATGYYTVVSKKTADNAFEKAKLARRRGDIALSQKLTNKTRRYDDRARIGFIGLQISSAGFATLLLLSR